jgi:hypothetical protein
LNLGSKIYYSNAVVVNSKLSNVQITAAELTIPGQHGLAYFSSKGKIK